MSKHDSKNAKEEDRKNEGDSPSPDQRARKMAPVRRQSLSSFGSMDPFQLLREEFGRLFDRFLPARNSGGQNGWNLEVEENDNSVVVHAEAPGFEPSDFDIQVRGDQLVLRATHKSHAEHKQLGYREWQSHEFYREIHLPSSVDSSHSNATYRNGVLTLSFPKTEESKGRRIEVQS